MRAWCLFEQSGTFKQEFIKLGVEAVDVDILNQFFPIEPKVIHQDRSKLGDYFRKPTQYWFVNMEPRKNFLFENLERCDSEVRKINDTRSQVDRSMISPVYARRFIREYLLPEEE